MKENHKHTEATGRRRSSCNSNSNRKPLSDCINIINSRNPAQSSSSTSTKNSTSFIKPTNDNTSLNPSAVSVNSVSTPSRAPKPSSDKALMRIFFFGNLSLGTASASPSREAFEPHSVYSRRQSADKRKGKRKAIAEPMSCFPALKTQFTGSEMNEREVTSLSKSCVLPYEKKQRQRIPKEDDAKYALPQDFIERQRAYFAEIDAFELPEEEVASIDELD
ncbi:conserved hypothetical protein [Ricinus communis]|uniref:Sororin C-terminal region domain-containing protein n=1 Tax=Ricinus communis TaxID=3988 RepID=B9S4B1_RICCO|nr:conserved hypothetical protein [Ricinus communis]